MTRRATFALDEATVERIRTLADLWEVSQSEAVRRAIERAAREATANRGDRLERLRSYHRQGGLDREEADSYLDSVAEGRRVWRGAG